MWIRQEPTGARNQKVASHIRTRKIKDVTPGFNKCYGAFCDMSGEKKDESCYSLSFPGLSAAARAFPALVALTEAVRARIRGTYSLSAFSDRIEGYGGPRRAPDACISNTPCPRVGPTNPH